MIAYKNIRYFIFILLIPAGCSTRPDNNAINAGKQASLDPDYTEITIPPNIAPLNFNIHEEGKAYYVEFSGAKGKSFAIASGKGKIRIPEKKWRKILEDNTGGEITLIICILSNHGQWEKYDPVKWYIAKEPVDPYLSYRLLYPGYESWSELSIRQRDLSGFSERPVIENRVAEDNCINCHAYNNGRSDDFMFHMRGSVGGTYFYTEGRLIRTNLKTDEMQNGAVYPRWHPSGRFVSFSSNKIVQRFHSADNKKVEVSDLESSLVMYDIEENKMMNIELPDMHKYMDTYPEWSPDGTFLYFCRAGQIGEEYDYREIRYDLFRVPFDIETRTVGEPEMVFNASAMKKSVAFPRISPDGRYIVLTLADYGCFPIWHREADLWSVNLETFEASRLELNSDNVDSYHSWSANGRWLVFSSKRGDGLTARPYISYIDENGKASRPFVVPQKDPDFYNRFLKSYNIPEFSSLKIDLNPGRIRRAAASEPIQAGWREI
ncbi:MAG TPA: hypothetical protein VK861_09165 [Bacteroidales bacterium]|nr:hypothetical protein [Bacteroidales bacterium]